MEKLRLIVNNVFHSNDYWYGDIKISLLLTGDNRQKT